MKKVTEIILLNDRNRWLAAVAGAALIAGLGGLIIGRSTSERPVAVADAHLVIGHAFNGEVLAKLSEAEVIPAKFPLLVDSNRSGRQRPTDVRRRGRSSRPVRRRRD